MYTFDQARGKRPHEFRLEFGKHRGKTLAEVPTTYLLWLADEAKSPSLRDLARAALDIDEKEDPAEPSPTTAAVALPLIIWKWEQAMLIEYDDSPFQLHVVAFGLQKLKSLCSEYTRKSWDLKGGAA